jgi:ACS family tartrate transporter-like MFS transporter
MKNEQSALHHADEEDRLSAREPVEERTRRRVTKRLMPFLIGAYLLAYVDRANLGIAKLQMQGNLG